jgi:prenylcysteine oxidase / farnesylcysteine lyase
MNRIQALEALVCLSAGGAVSVVGGNWRIFNEMIIDSGAKLNLDTPVISIDKAIRGGKILWGVSSAEGSRLYDGVVIASPFVFPRLSYLIKHQSNISMNPVPISIPAVNYMTLHVTLVATKAVINPGYFKCNNSVPSAILTTLPNNTADTPIFNSLSRILRLPTGESVYKIFSPDKITTKILEELFVGAPIDWTFRKAWQAYPQLDAISTFAPLELYPGIEGAGVWYTSGIESFISTMETSALSGRNIATLIFKRLWGENNSSL